MGAVERGEKNLTLVTVNRVCEGPEDFICGIIQRALIATSENQGFRAQALFLIQL